MEHIWISTRPFAFEGFLRGRGGSLHPLSPVIHVVVKVMSVVISSGCVCVAVQRVICINGGYVIASLIIMLLLSPSHVLMSNSKKSKVATPCEVCDYNIPRKLLFRN